MTVVTESRGLTARRRAEFRKRFALRMIEIDIDYAELEAKLVDIGTPIPRRTLTAYANGESMPIVGTKRGNERLKALAKALDSPLDWLISIETEESSHARAEDE